MDVHIPVEQFLETQNKQAKILSGNNYFNQQNKVGGTTSLKIAEEDKMVDKLTAHDYELKEIRNILGSVASNLKDTNVQVNKLAESISKLDIFLEKQNSMELRHSDSINRIHKRIDDNVVNVEELIRTKNDFIIVKRDVDELMADKRKLWYGLLSALGLGLWQLVVK